MVRRLKVLEHGKPPTTCFGAFKWTLKMDLRAHKRLFLLIILRIHLKLETQIETTKILFISSMCSSLFETNLTPFFWVHSQTFFYYFSWYKLSVFVWTVGKRRKKWNYANLTYGSCRINYAERFFIVLRGNSCLSMGKLFFIVLQCSRNTFNNFFVEISFKVFGF